MDIKIPSVQMSGFIALAGIYGIYGSPTPETLGITEIAVLAILLLIIGVKGLTSPLTVFLNLPTLKEKALHPIFWLYLLFLWGTVASVTTGLFYGQPIYMILRDYAGFLMLCTPVFFFPYIHQQETHSSIKYCLIAIGIIFTLRVLYGLTNDDTGHIGALYLSISPEIIFSGCYLLMTGLNLLFIQTAKSLHIHPVKKLLCITGCTIGTILVIELLFLNQMRAGISALVLSVITITAWVCMFQPKRAVLLLCTLGMVLLLSQDVWKPSIDALWAKQTAVGFNLRGEELTAVTKEIDHSFLNQLIGLGWGAGIESPSSKGMVVNFTHNLFSSLWLKTGSIGVLLMMMFSLSLYLKLTKTIKLKEPDYIVLATALILCISINTLLYGGYKSLGFGLCLTLLISICFSEEKTVKSHHSIA